MRVLRSYIAVPPSPGGMERHVHELSAQQRRRGIEVYQIYSQGHVEPGDGMRVLAGWRILRLWPHALRDLLFYSAACIAVWRRRARVDVVHIHGDWSAFLFGRGLRRLTGAPVLVGSIHDRVPDSWWRELLYRMCIRGYSAFYATGYREAELFTEWLGQRCQWITSGVNECFFAPDVATTRTTDVLVVGSLVPKKGMDLVIETARLLPQRSFRVVGDGPERQSLSSKARTAGVANLRFLGSLDHRALAAEYAGARLLLSTSYREGTPTVVLEAMAAGLPIVTTRSNDFAALLGDGDGGLAVESRDPAEVSRAVERFLGDDGLATRVGQRNRMAAADYSWPAVADRVTRLMEDALTKARDA